MARERRGTSTILFFFLSLFCYVLYLFIYLFIYFLQQEQKQLPAPPSQDQLTRFAELSVKMKRKDEGAITDEEWAEFHALHQHSNVVKQEHRKVELQESLLKICRSTYEKSDSPRDSPRAQRTNTKNSGAGESTVARAATADDASAAHKHPIMRERVREKKRARTEAGWYEPGSLVFVDETITTSAKNNTPGGEQRPAFYDPTTNNNSNITTTMHNTTANTPTNTILSIDNPNMATFTTTAYLPSFNSIQNSIQHTPISPKLTTATTTTTTTSTTTTTTTLSQSTTYTLESMQTHWENNAAQATVKGEEVDSWNTTNTNNNSNITQANSTMNNNINENNNTNQTDINNANNTNTSNYTNNNTNMNNSNTINNDINTNTNTNTNTNNINNGGGVQMGRRNFANRAPPISVEWGGEILD
jgi:hypothetical protein